MTAQETDWNDPREFRASLEAMYPGFAESDSARDLFSLPDDLFWWTISLMRGRPVKVPAYDETTWEEWLNALGHHYIIPLLSYLSRNIPEDALPPQYVRSRMRRDYHFASIRALRTEQQVVEIHNRLLHEGIESVILKGPALADLVYPYPALRTGSDIDLLIRPEEVEKAITTLKNLGYHSKMDTHAISYHVFHHTSLLPPERTEALPVEVHWRLLYLPGDVTPHLEDVFTRVIEVNTHMGSFATLDIPDAFIYAATHMSIGHSTMLRLSWIADIWYLANYITEKGLWDELFRRTSGGFLLAAVKQACRESAFWFEPETESREPGFWPELGPGAEERFRHLVNVAERTERHIIEAVRQAPSAREALLSIIHIFFLTEELGDSGSFHGTVNHLRQWMRIMAHRLKNRYTSPPSAKGRSLP